MPFPKLSFPLQVDFGSEVYWIGNAGPFQYGEALTAFFVGNDLADGVGDSLLLMRDLERYLRTFGEHLHPYARDEGGDPDVLLSPEQGQTECSLCFAFHPLTDGGVGVFVKRYTFRCLRDFLYVELCTAIQHGNAPRQCRLCGNWFLHVQGEKSIYCERIAPGEAEKTCREAGARVVFEKKIQSEDTWKLYKRAYKKYYARFKKGNMTQEEFRDWAADAANWRDETDKRIRETLEAHQRELLLGELKQKLNEP